MSAMLTARGSEAEHGPSAELSFLPAGTIRGLMSAVLVARAEADHGPPTEATFMPDVLLQVDDRVDPLKDIAGADE